MLKSRTQLIQEEKLILAPYAVSNEEFGGRVYHEEEHQFRVPFLRDKERVLHSSSFKRLQYKTQVFINSIGEDYRNRLTHTIEVAGVSKTIAMILGLNIDLSESIAFAHDLGHTPFGHAGQDQLSDLMKNFGGFEHNKQSLRLVQDLETRYPNFKGLNLTSETLIGLMKHGGDYLDSDIHEVRKLRGPSLEAMIVNFADEIAYNTHDIEDSLEMKMIQIDELNELNIWKKLEKIEKEKYPNIDEKVFYRTVLRRLLNYMVIDLIHQIEMNISEFLITNRGVVRDLWQKGIRIVHYSDTLEEEVRELKEFMKSKVYKNPEVIRMSEYGKKIIRELFHYFCKNEKLIPLKYLENLEKDGLERIVCDYVSGMTDRFAEKMYKSIF